MTELADFQLSRRPDGTWGWASAIQVGERWWRLHRHGELSAEEARFMDGLLADALVVIEPDSDS